MLFSARKTVSVVGTPEQLAPPGVTGECWIYALPANTDVVAIGGQPGIHMFDGRVTTNGPQATSGSEEGFLLNAGESLPFPVNAAEVWIDAAVADEGVCFVVVGR